MFLNDYEEKIIGDFLRKVEKEDVIELRFEWQEGSVTAIVDTVFEDIDDDTGEEYISFSLKVLSCEGKPPIIISKDNLCLINYKNFPLRIDKI